MYIYWFEDLDKITGEDFDKLSKLVSPERRKKISGFKFYKNKCESLMGYILLMYSFREYRKEMKIRKADGEKVTFTESDELPEIYISPGGKPFFKGTEDIFFNISHCPEGVVCVISSGEAGIDIQEVPGNEIDIDSVFSDGELKTIRSSSHSLKEKIRFWTLKESYLKYTGKGLDSCLKNYDFSDISFSDGECTVISEEKNPFNGLIFNNFNFNNIFISSCSKTFLRKIIKVDYKELAGLRDLADFTDLYKGQDQHSLTL